MTNVFVQDQTSTSLLEKLCHRFRGTHDPQQWRNIAFCISQLTFTEKSIKKLQELMPCFQDKVDMAHAYDYKNQTTLNFSSAMKRSTRVLMR